jgi:hypothetical protein
MKFALYSSYKESYSRQPSPTTPHKKNPLVSHFLVIYLSGCPNRLPPDVILVADDKNR